MIERIAVMPPGTLGMRVWGDVTREDYVDGLMPALQEAVDTDGELRLVFQIGPDFDKFTAGMMAADTTKGLSFGVEHWSKWKRMAVVTDVDWLRHAMQLFGWMTPGEQRLFSIAELDEAKEWVDQGR
jgi:stage II sporulation SpoAA-like protein